MPGFLKADFLAWKSCDTSVPPCDLQFGRKVIQVFQTRRICGMGFHSSENVSRLIFIPDFGFTTCYVLWTWMFYKLRKQPRYELRWCVGCLTCWIFKPEKKHHESLRPRLSLNMHHTPVQVTLACSSQSLIKMDHDISRFTILSLSGH